MVLSLALLLALPFAEIRNHAEEIVEVHTDWHPTEAHPVYLIAVPPQEKMAPRPLNVPIVPARQTETKNSGPNELQLPFAMTPDRAVRIANGLIEDSDFQLARAYLEEAKKQDPNSIDVLTGLARCYYELGRDDEALALYQAAVAQNPSVWQTQFYLGSIHLENGRYPQAVEALENAYKLKSDDPKTIRSLGVALSKAGKSADAITYLSRVTALRRYIKEDFYYLGEAYANDQQWLKAAQAFKEGVDQRGTDPNGYFYWATMLFNADKLDEAFEGYQKVRSVDVSASHSGTSRYVAEIYRLRGMSEKALGQYQLLLAREPNDTEALFQAGYISFKLNQLDQAKNYFRKIIEVDPKHAGGAANFAALDARYNEKRAGLHEKMPGITLREVVQANPNSVEAHVNLGAQLITEGAYSEALPILERAVTLRPNSAAAQFDLGLAQIKNQKYEEAVASNKKALELRPNWQDAYNNLGLAYAGLKRWEEAAAAHREALRLKPEYAGALYNLGIAHLRLGDNATARQLFEKLRQMNWDLQARLWLEILAAGGTAIVVAAPTPTPTPAVPPATQPSPEPSPPVAKDAGDNNSSSPASSSTEEECPSPIYTRSNVTQMAFIKEQLQVPYTAAAVQNKVEGKIVLQLVVCSNGHASEITIKEPLPFGLTEQAIDAIRKASFQPALLGTQPVSVLMKQTFNCAQQMCQSVSP
jgi:tetratricopeptide (TPR) repeat protein